MDPEDSPSGPALTPDVDPIIQLFANHFRGREVKPQAVLWPDADDLVQRFHALTSGIDWESYDEKNRFRLIDVGCGPGFLLDYLESLRVLQKIDYLGVDLHEEVLAAARRRWPGYAFVLQDVRQETLIEPEFDLAIFCGVFTCKFSLDYTAMERLLEQTLLAVWPRVRGFLAFNAMSKHVDWERADLFHYPADSALAFARTKLQSRHVRLLHDYGLYEYSCQVFRRPNVTDMPTPASWR